MTSFKRRGRSVSSVLLRKSLYILAALVLLFGADTVAAADTLKVRKYVIGGGGGASTTVDFKFKGTVGQTGIGRSNTIDYQVFSGFWMGLPQNCCLDITGDLNFDGEDNTVLDLTFLMNQIFRGGPVPFCSEEGDLNGDGQPLQLLDLTFMINMIYRGGPDPVSCD